MTTSVPVPMAELSVALDLGPSELVSLVGGGGKTSSLFALGAASATATICTTTTKMGADRTNGFTVLVDPTNDAVRANIGQGPLLVWSQHDDNKAIGVSAERADQFFDLVPNVIVEADGSRRQPFKAPKEFEPVIPTRTTMHVACIGAAALGRVIADRCHRPLRVAAVARCRPGDRLTPERAAVVLRSEHGSMKGRPPRSRFAVVIFVGPDRNDPDRASALELAEIVSADTPTVIAELGASHPRTRRSG